MVTGVQEPVSWLDTIYVVLEGWLIERRVMLDENVCTLHYSVALATHLIGWLLG